ncbi:hypothetical protein GCM10027299_34620 [Larkinella ripae]
MLLFSGKLSRLAGFINALRDNKYIFHLSQQILQSAFCEKLGIEYTRLKGEGENYDTMYNETDTFLKNIKNDRNSKMS